MSLATFSAGGIDGNPDMVYTSSALIYDRNQSKTLEQIFAVRPLTIFLHGYETTFTSRTNLNISKIVVEPGHHFYIYSSSWLFNILSSKFIRIFNP